MTDTVVFEGKRTVTVTTGKVLNTEMNRSDMSTEVALPTARELFAAHRTNNYFIVH